MSKFRLDQQADVNMTHLVGYVSAVPARLIEVFGPPTGSVRTMAASLPCTTGKRRRCTKRKSSERLKCCGQAGSPSCSTLGHG